MKENHNMCGTLAHSSGRLVLLGKRSVLLGTQHRCLCLPPAKLRTVFSPYCLVVQAYEHRCSNSCSNRMHHKDAVQISALTQNHCNLVNL